MLQVGRMGKMHGGEEGRLGKLRIQRARPPGMGQGRGPVSAPGMGGGEKSMMGGIGRRQARERLDRLAVLACGEMRLPAPAVPRPAECVPAGRRR